VLQEIFDLKADIARATRPDRGVYDANVDQFEINMRAERLGGCAVFVCLFVCLFMGGGRGASSVFVFL
jgi:hypothetical protein